MTDLKRAVQRQFGNVAANYSTSAVHAKGADLDQMVELAALTGQEQVLDAGCGAGHTALAFARDAAQVTALDLTPEMLTQVQLLAAERGISNVITRQGDVEQIPFEDAAFDLVSSRYSAHHWHHPARALREVQRVLKPGGTFLLSDIVAPDDPTQDTFLQAIELLRDPSHVRDHRIGEWRSMLEATGFTVRVAMTWELLLNFDDWIRRMATPAPNAAMIRTLFDGAPAEVRSAMVLQADYTFTIPGALLHATLA
jgi:ubiquinone/menaquinone biosynthesis C-methylase UbiE